MPHSICTASGKEGFSYLREVWDLLLDPALDMGSKLERLFERETDAFGLEYAFLARIDRDEGTEHFEVVHGPDGTIEPNVTVPLSETYCRMTISDPDGTVAVSDAVDEGWEDDPAYERFGLGTYLGTTVSVDGDLYGTLCFANGEPRDDSIEATERYLLELYGQWVTYEVNQWTGPPTHETVSWNLGEQTPPRSPEIDSMTNALSKRPRRFVLHSIAAESDSEEVSIAERAEGAGIDRLSLHHVHLPTLEQEGYVDWDLDANTVSPGPNYPQIEPFVRLLDEYTDEFSE